ncbi:MAG: hypothetical protein ABIA11_01230 [Patescibacteria group bacterium]
MKHLYDERFEKADKGLTKIEILVRDPDKELVKFLQKIRVWANPGHSFIVVVDPDVSKSDGGSEKFFFDGDGSFYLKEILVDGEKVK